MADTPACRSPPSCAKHHGKVHHGLRIERDPHGRWHTYPPTAPRSSSAPHCCCSATSSLSHPVRHRADGAIRPRPRSGSGRVLRAVSRYSCHRSTTISRSPLSRAVWSASSRRLSSASARNRCRLRTKTTSSGSSARTSRNSYRAPGRGGRGREVSTPKCSRTAPSAQAEFARPDTPKGTSGASTTHADWRHTRRAPAASEELSRVTGTPGRAHRLARSGPAPVHVRRRGRTPRLVTVPPRPRRHR